MIKPVSKNLLILFILLFGGGALIAQDSSTNVASTQADWVVFVEESPKECLKMIILNQTYHQTLEYFYCIPLRQINSLVL